MSELDANFVEVINLLNKNNVPYWVCHGTLLGIIRDGNLIPWDHDVDIAIWADKTSKEFSIKLMTDVGYTVKSDGGEYDFIQFVKDGAREVDFNFYHLTNDKEMAYTEWFVPRSPLTKTLDFFSNPNSYHSRKLGWLTGRADVLSPVFKALKTRLMKQGQFYKSAGYTTPAKFLHETELKDVHGLQVRVPKDYLGVLEFVYGPDWKTPKEQFDWTTESPSTRISKSRFLGRNLEP